jgi:hypothetical protein
MSKCKAVQDEKRILQMVVRKKQANKVVEKRAIKAPASRVVAR